ncbi:MAG TPA: hypothetical protein VHC90_03640 [Bryobacteraceae bacterium]|nr:hypothetical protein [Bryobacteraceae bacterium]
MHISRRGLLVASSILMLLGTVGHTIGNLSPSKDPAVIAAYAAMKSSHPAVGMGMTPSMFDVHMLLVLIMSVTFTAIAALNLALVRALSDHALRRVIWINAIWVAAFTALCAWYQVPPPLISGILIELPLAAALLVK